MSVREVVVEPRFKTPSRASKLDPFADRLSAWLLAQTATRSRAVGRNPFDGRSQSERTEETPFLPEDESRRLPLDKIVALVDTQMPVRAKRVV